MLKGGVALADLIFIGSGGELGFDEFMDVENAPAIEPKMLGRIAHLAEMREVKTMKIRSGQSVHRFHISHRVKLRRCSSN